MIKVEYILDGTKGELELTKLTTFDSKEQLLNFWDISSTVDNYLVEDVMGQLKPEVDAQENMYACELGGKRNQVTPESQAKKFGFTQLIATLDGKVRVIC